MMEVYRYIDSFFIWKHGEEKLRNFVEIDCQIEIDLYVKPTDSHQYLHSSFCHPY